MNKQLVMEALLDSNSNVSSEVISYVGNNLSDAETNVGFQHESDSVWEACHIQEFEVKEFTEALNNYMNSLPDGQRPNSKAVEFIVNSGNKKWITISIIAGIVRPREESSTSSMDEGLKDMIIKSLIRRLNDEK
jgi:hypothetical protein